MIDDVQTVSQHRTTQIYRASVCQPSLHCIGITPYASSQTDINDNSPVFQPSVYTVDVLETAPYGPAVVLTQVCLPACLPDFLPACLLA